jgi:hypothetical protein
MVLPLSIKHATKLQTSFYAVMKVEISTMKRGERWEVKRITPLCCSGSHISLHTDSVERGH